jgi:hypothetical protein
MKEGATEIAMRQPFMLCPDCGQDVNGGLEKVKANCHIPRQKKVAHFQLLMVE